jgi:acetylornithine deacetylase/succinyl-diaminopimelate desuccinylase-like protein
MGIAMTNPDTMTVLPRSAHAKLDIRFGPNMEPEEVVSKFKLHLIEKGYEDIEVTVRDHYTWSKTDASNEIVKKLISAYCNHGRKPEIWPRATWAAPYFVFSRESSVYRLCQEAWGEEADNIIKMNICLSRDCAILKSL